MARPREFDTQQALDEIIELFRAKGFEKTSFAQLEKVTGLKKASLFAAFGCKEELFKQALKAYHSGHCNKLSADCSKRSARASLRDWLTKAAGSGKTSRGCLTINTLLETAPHNSKCAHIVALQVQALEQMLEELVRRGIKNSEFRRSLNPECAAKYLLCVVSGLQALSRTSHTCAKRKNLDGIVSLVLNALR